MPGPWPPAQPLLRHQRGVGCRGHPVAVSPAAREGRLLAYLERASGIRKPVELDQRGDEPGPAGLVTGAQPGTVVTVEVLVEEDVVAPVGIRLELLHVAVDRSSPVFITGKGADQALR